MSGTLHPLLFLALMSMALAAPAAHITDKLLAGFYDQPTAQGQPQRVLPSGTPVEILERKGDFSRVRLSDNTEGWVESKYITDAKPAQVMLLETQARAGALEQELATTRAELARAQDALEAASRLDAQQERTPAAMTVPATDAPVAASALKRMLPWALALAGLAFIAGFACGVALFQRRFRKRFGGLRL